MTLRSSPIRHSLVSLAAAALIAGCGSDPTTYELEVLAFRFEKNMSLSAPDSPVLRPEERARFQGLRYFDVDSTFRFVVPLIADPDPSYVMVEQRLSEPEPHLKLGVVEIPFEDGPRRLTVFQYAPDRPESLWIPFTDATSGTETYGGGRYVDGQLRGSMAIVDFNYAYNPYCDYNPNYSCAIPPDENRLSAAVRAGEMKSLLLGDH